MATQLTELYAYVEAELPRCPKPLILQNIFTVINDFCERTQAWQDDLDPITVIEDVDTYDLDGEPANSDIIRPTKVLLNDVELTPGLDYTMPSRTQLKLAYTPETDTDDALEVRVCLRLEAGATDICNALWDDWYRAWAAGVKARLMAMPNKPWTDARAAVKYEREYLEMIGDAIMDAQQGGMNQTLIAKPDYVWA